MTCIKPSVENLSVYRVPQDGTVIKLNQNESPYDIPSSVKARILEGLSAQTWNRYPRARDSSLLTALADYTGHEPDGIVIGNGSNEIIQAVFAATCDSGDRAVMVKPDFVMYSRVAAILGVRAVEVPLLPSFTLDVEALVAAARGARLVILASPNVPTGILIEPVVLERIAAQCRGMFVVDEAYFEFSNITALDLLPKYESMVIIRTLSKACSLAGARFGYGLTSPALAQNIEKAKLPFSVGVFQHVAGKTLLKERAFIQDVTKKVIAERDWLFNELQTIPGVTPIPSRANFMLMTFKDRSAQDVFDALYEKGVLVRHFSVPELQHALRVTVGNESENRRFIKALRSIMEQDTGRL
ncbi:histidinol-phosphate transaminase [candidate division WOR-3 bacterium]|nr:histidinol-phosphate transaminase [candidate division WOR-3 bacterium]